MKSRPVYLLSLLLILVIISKSSFAVDLFTLLVEPDNPTTYDKINLFVKPASSFSANMTISSVATNLTNIPLTQDSEYLISEERFFGKATYTVRVTVANDSNSTEAETFSVKEPAATAGTCGDRVCQVTETYRNCFNDCYNILPSDGKVCYELTGQKIYIHFGDLFADYNYSLSDDIERLGSQDSYDSQTNIYCVKRDNGTLSDDDKFYISKNGLNWNAYIYGERTIPEDVCKTSADCDDSNACTTDLCSGIPKNCTHSVISGCSVAVCGDSRCDPSESKTSCPKDCGCPAGKILSGNSCIENITVSRSVCGDSICASDESSSTCCSDCACSEGSSCVNSSCQKRETVIIEAGPVETPKTNYALISAIIGIVLIASLGVLFTIRRMHTKPVPELGDYVKNMRMQGYTDEQIKEQLARFYGPDVADKVIRNNPP